MFTSVHACNRELRWEQKAVLVRLQGRALQQQLLWTCSDVSFMGSTESWMKLSKTAKSAKKMATSACAEWGEAVWDVLLGAPSAHSGRSNEGSEDRSYIGKQISKFLVTVRRQFRTGSYVHVAVKWHAFVKASTRGMWGSSWSCDNQAIISYESYEGNLFQSLIQEREKEKRSSRGCRCRNMRLECRRNMKREWTWGRGKHDYWEGRIKCLCAPTVCFLTTVSLAGGEWGCWSLPQYHMKSGHTPE